MIITDLAYVWSLLLLCSSLLLHLVALVVVVRSAGSCHDDPAVPPLISVLGESLTVLTLSSHLLQAPGSSTS